jgi:hypothetical protein
MLCSSPVKAERNSSRSTAGDLRRSDQEGQPTFLPSVAGRFNSVTDSIDRRPFVWYIHACTTSQLQPSVYNQSVATIRAQSRVFETITFTVSLLIEASVVFLVYVTKFSCTGLDVLADKYETLQLPAAPDFRGRSLYISTRTHGVTPYKTVALNPTAFLHVETT